MSQMQLDFDLHLVAPTGRVVRVPHELLCMTPEHHMPFLRRKYRDNWDKIVSMYRIGKALNAYYRITNK